jgi:predicted transport protein
MPVETSERILENYSFFRERLQEVDPEDLYRAIHRLDIVDVRLIRGIDDPQLIFESLNSTGVDLSQSDLIRNYILMRLPEKEQTRLYDTYWSRIEELYRGSEKAFDAFARDYIALERRASKQARADQIYFAFRRVFDDSVSLLETMESFLERLLRFARYHAAFSVGAPARAELQRPLAQLRRLVELAATLIMRLFECHEIRGTLSTAEFVEAIELIESYVFRRVICGMQTRGYWLEFARLAYRIDDERPLESLKVGLARLTESYAFPGDAEFRKALQETDVYHKRVCHHLLDRLENHGSREPSDTSQYSIEHIMPQNEKLLPEWRQMLGENWQEVQEVWLHRLGNLTLTGYNSTYSDRPFEEKKTIEGGFADSSVRLNRFVREQKIWTEEEMRRRGKALARKALEVWPPLEVDPALIEAARHAEMRERAARRGVDKVPMTGAARELFGVLREKVTALDAEIIELAEQKSVSYHGPAFFLEVVPRKAALSLLLTLDFNEVEDASGLAQDTSQWRFIVNATYDGGVLIVVHDTEDIEKALPMIHQAHELART